VRADEQIGRAPSRDIVQKIARQVEEGSAGLPVGVQVVARPWQEHIALSAMHVIESQNKSSVGSLARSSVADGAS
jgi:fatty acid amide hydrolase